MALNASKLVIGESHNFVLTEDITRTQIVQYAGASGDYNPLHTDEIFATSAAGFPSVFAHGMLTMGVAGKALTDYVGDGRLTRFGVRFTRQVWPGDALHACLVVKSILERQRRKFVELDVIVRNQHNADVLSGYAEALIDD